jgi:hypothetical protein
MAKRRPRKDLEMYAFWTGLGSTVISLLQVIVIWITRGG